MLEITLNHISNKFNYLIDVNFIEEENKLVMIFDNVDYEPLKMDLYRISVNPYYEDAVYNDDNKETCFFFRIPPRFIDDFKLFINGKYSQFSSYYKDLLTKTYGNRRLEGVSPKTGFPNVSIYDTIYPTKETKYLLAKRLHVDSDLIQEVLEPPKKELEEYKKIEELC